MLICITFHGKGFAHSEQSLVIKTLHLWVKYLKTPAKEFPCK